MNFLAVLNRDGGTLRSIDLETFAAASRVTLEEAGHSFRIEIVAGAEIVAALQRAAEDGSAEVVIAGGGDGTASAAAVALMNTEKILAILPAGTMNLFARGLHIPLQLDAAVAAFADGSVRAIDIASANGRPFVHQFSIGMHADLVERREALNYRSRLGKIRASLRAAFDTFWNPPRIRVRIDLRGASIIATTSSVGVSNNLFGEGHLPFPDIPDRGELGIYITRARRRSDLFRFLFHLAAGSWRANPQVEIHRSDYAKLTLLSSNRRFRCAVDGELHVLDRETEIRCLPGALKVLIPADAGTR